MKKFRQWRSNQGRSPKKQGESLIVFGISACVLFVLLISLVELYSPSPITISITLGVQTEDDRGCQLARAGCRRAGGQGADAKVV